MENRKPLTKKQRTIFLVELSKLDAMEFLGVLHLMGIGIFEEEEKETPRPFGDVLEDVVEKYEGEPKKRRNRILAIVKKANKQKEQEEKEKKREEKG